MEYERKKEVPDDCKRFNFFTSSRKIYQLSWAKVKKDYFSVRV